MRETFKGAQAEIHEYINKGGKMSPEIESIVKDVEKYKHI